MANPNRRRFTRTTLDLPVKVRCEMTGRYLAGRTQNASEGGLLVKIDHPSLLVPGQRVLVGTAQHKRQAIIEQAHMVSATVVRSLRMAGGQTVAVAYDEPQRLLAAG